VEEPDHYALRVEWESLEGHEQGFRGSPEFRTFFQEMHHYRPTPIARVKVS
jgi:hypothetical protein